MNKVFVLLVLFVSLSGTSFSQLRQTKLYIDDGNGNFSILRAPSGGGTLTLPAPGSAGALSSDASGILSIGALGITNGGTGANNADDAIANLLPSQSSNSGLYLMTNGTSLSWGSPASSSHGITMVSLNTGNFNLLAGNYIGLGALTATAFGSGVAITRDDTLQNLCVNLNFAATISYTFGVYKNGVSTGVTLTISAGNSSACNTTDRIAVTRSDYISIRVNIKGSPDSPALVSYELAY
jgi:hypothetical protein